MWQDYNSFIHLFVYFLSNNTITSSFSIREVLLKRAWPTQLWEGSLECRFQLRMSWTQWSVRPRSWLRWVLGDWGRTASCHPGRPGSGEVGAGRQSRCRCRPEPLLNTSGRARARCNSTPPSDCPAGGCLKARWQGGGGGRCMRGLGERLECEALTPEEPYGVCSFPCRPDTGLELPRQRGEGREERDKVTNKGRKN